MKVGELLFVLKGLPRDVEVRIGDQIEAGPYSHVKVGAVFKGAGEVVIICGDPDGEWFEEAQGVDHDLPVIWKEPS